MKNYFIIPLVCLCFIITGMIKTLDASNQQSIDYLTQGKTLIAQEEHDLATFITTYTKQKSLFSSLQRVQIESQYTGINKTLTTAHDNLINDKGENLKNDYTEVVTLYFYEEKLPLLYSELFTFKAMYLHQRLTTLSTTSVAYIVSKVSPTTQAYANTQATTITQALTSMQSGITSITLDYNLLTNFQGQGSDMLTSYEHILKDIKSNQQAIMHATDTINTSFAALIASI